MTTPPTDHEVCDLGDFFQVDPEKLRRITVVQQPSLRVLHFSLAPQQGIPLHTHPECEVIIQGLVGSVILMVAEELVSLVPGRHLYLSGKTPVSLKNNTGEPSAVLITLAKRGS